MRDYLTIVGDQSDNVKGIAGIGEKGAAALLQEFGTLGAIYAQLDTLLEEKRIKPSQGLALKAFLPRFAEVQTLITLRTDAPVAFEEIITPRTHKDVPPMDEPELDSPEPEPTLPPEVNGPVPTPAPVSPPKMNGTLTVLTPEQALDWKAQLEPTSMAEAISLAKHAFDSKLFSAYGTPQAVLMTVLAGRELGLSAMASLRAIHIIEGKPTMSADLIRALVVKSGAVKYFRCTERTADRSTWETQRGDDPPISLTYTMEEAKAAGVVKPNSGWVKFAADMLVARASSKLARIVCPDILHGIYTPEELRENQ
jgi:hypothetical protein